jgi:hypothetical protein
MQGDLFGDSVPRAPAEPPAKAVFPAKPASPTRGGAAKVRLAPAAEDWRALARQLPAQLRFGVST